MGIATLKMSSARDNLVDAIVLAQTEAVILERYGRPAAVLISPERYDELMTAFENSIDAVAFDSAMQEEGANIPWEQVKSDLGLASHRVAAGGRTRSCTAGPRGATSRAGCNRTSRSESTTSRGHRAARAAGTSGARG